MKTMGLALSIFALTATLAALDFSGTHDVHITALAGAQHASGYSTSNTTAASMVKSEALDEDEEEETDGELVRTFLVTPKAVPAANGKAAALRYD
jgi:hypothetical protein